MTLPQPSKLTPRSPSQANHAAQGSIAICTNFCTLALLLLLTASCATPKRSTPLDACREGQAKACVDVAKAIETGGAGYDLPDPSRALTWYRRACALGAGQGCFGAGAILRRADGVQEDLPGARVLAHRGCALRAPLACLLLATMELQGQGGPVDPKRGARRLERLCRGGLLRACNDLGLMRANADPAAARRQLRQACDAGSTLACGNLGILLHNAGDAEAAAPLLERGCRGEVADACLRLTALPVSGEPRAARDLRLYQRACKLGSLDGCGGLALRLFLGGPGPARPEEGLRIWRSLCDKEGHGASCYNLAVAYRRGAAPSCHRTRPRRRRGSSVRAGDHQSLPPADTAVDTAAD